MVTSLIRGSLLAALALVSAAPAKEAPPVPLAVRAVSFPADSWDGPQFVAADKKGEVFLLDPLSLEVIPAARSAPDRGPQKLKPLPSMRSAGPVRRAAMSRDGDDWAVLDASSVRLFRAGKEVVVAPIPWNPHGLAFQGSEVVVSVLPEAIEPGAKSGRNPPLILAWDGRRWNVLAEDDALEIEDPASRFSERQRRVASVFADSERRLWVASLHRYRLRQYSPGGRLLTEIRVDRGDVREASAEAVGARRQEIEDELAAQGVPPEVIAKGTFRVNSAETVLVAVAEGHDGRMYILAHDKPSTEGGGDLVLDRYDPVLNQVERAQLDLEVRGHLSMAVGKDGLYLAAFHAGEGGRWLLPWEDLDAASWRAVEGVAISSGS